MQDNKTLTGKARVLFAEGPCFFHALRKGRRKICAAPPTEIKEHITNLYVISSLYNTIIAFVKYFTQFLRKIGSMYGERLRELRENKNLTQKQLAKILNTDQQAISRYEREQIDLSTNFILKVCDYFGVTADYLLGRTDY